MKSEQKLALNACQRCELAGEMCWVSSISKRCAHCAKQGRTITQCGVDPTRYRHSRRVDTAGGCIDAAGGRVDAAGGLLEAMLARQWEGTVWLANAFHTQFGNPLPEFMSADLVAVSAPRTPPSPSPLSSGGDDMD